MTVIAWDGKTLAADKLSMRDGLRATVTKIHWVYGDLVGFAGEAVFGLQMVQWIREGSKPVDFPASQRGDDWVPIIVITKDRRILVYERTPYPLRIEEPFYAIGSGRELATMAMKCGKGAEEAVLLTNELTAYCGNGVDTLTLT
jgi:hypothetical protein